MFARYAFCAFAVACVASAQAFTLFDDFESYAYGTLPSPTWSDLGLIMPDGTIPDPSAVIERRTTAFNTQTRAVFLGDYYGYTAGIYTEVPVDLSYSIKADVRVDRFNTGVPSASPQDWAAAVGFNVFDGGLNPASWVSAQVYASTLTKDWRLYAYDGVHNSTDIALGSSVKVGEWYDARISFDDSNGTVHTFIREIRTDTVVVDRTDVIGDWSTAHFDVAAVMDGDWNYDDPNNVPGLANVDNVGIEVVPEPATMAVLGLGLVALVRRRSTRRR